MTQSIFVITGMPRSGTSFTASLLQSAGLDVGQRLMAPGHGNVKGFFENLDFVEFHEMVLRSQGLNQIGWVLQKEVNVEGKFVEKAKEIIAKNSLNSAWGWKDPRTTLFLNFWLDLLPNAKFILIYRSPWEVVDSIYRRGDEIFFEEPELAVKIWINYNQKILDFYDKFSEHCLLASIDNIVNKSQLLIDAINAKFEMNLVKSTANIYDSSLLHTLSRDAHRASLIAHHFPQTWDIYQKLGAKEVLLSETHDPFWLEQIKDSSERVGAFQDWLTIRKLETEVKRLHSELEQLQ